MATTIREISRVEHSDPEAAKIFGRMGKPVETAGTRARKWLVTFIKRWGAAQPADADSYDTLDDKADGRADLLYELVERLAKAGSDVERQAATEAARYVIGGGA